MLLGAELSTEFSMPPSIADIIDWSKDVISLTGLKMLTEDNSTLGTFS